MLKPFKAQGIVKNVIFLGTILSSTLYANAAETVKDSNQTDAGKTQTSATVKKKPVVRSAQDLAQNSEDVMTVTAVAEDKKPGSKTTITAADMQKKGGNDFGTIMRYEPLISGS
jgi:hemoglobin/transferrin/lactoferrin receptor protein